MTWLIPILVSVLIIVLILLVRNDKKDEIMACPNCHFLTSSTLILASRMDYGCPRCRESFKNFLVLDKQKKDTTCKNNK